MFKINVKDFLSIAVSKVLIKSSKILFKGGSNFPGRVALKISSNVLKTAASGYDVILVTGTNGKTTTTSMIYNMVKDSYKNVITNATGANMLPGIVSCFTANYKWRKKDEKRYAVIEVDEANVKLVTEFISPKVITITNLFRDQLDRYGEVYTTLNKILDGINKVPDAVLVLNGDESLLGDLKLPNKTIYYGFDCAINDQSKIDINADAKFCKKCKTPYKYNYIIYNHLGDFYCENCGYKRPELDFYIERITEINSNGSLLWINGNEYYINQPGVYNIYNGLCAFSVAKTLGIKNADIFACLKSQSSSFGRQEIIDIDGKQVKIILVKNPAGFDEAINTITLDKRNISIAFLLNDNYADGRDVSWIWDVKFEKFNQMNLNKVMVSGVRLYDMAIRLKIAGLNYKDFDICENNEALLKSIQGLEAPTVYILATYTAMINLRKFLNGKGYIKKLW
ncbi:MAG: Mur ligase family protein [Bacillota bacterium]|nr:Mur ligase family protein [Bacillota bacterium]